MKIFLRIMDQREGKLKLKRNTCIQVIDCHSITITPPPNLNWSKYEIYGGFSEVFSELSQEEVYTRVSPVVDDFLCGKSRLFAASGPSGLGTTHTMFGSAREPGLVPLALRHIYRPSVSSQDGPKRSFYLSIFEIYLDNEKREKLSDLSPAGGEVQLEQTDLKGLKEFHMPDYMQAEAFIAHALLRLNSDMTNTNTQSRSQYIIRIRCAFANIVGMVENQVKESVLIFLDLAGAEREQKTGNQGIRLLDSTFINRTSMVFGLCVKSLLEHQKNPKIPLKKHFQSSLLTRYLRDYLEGKKRMALLLTLRPVDEDFLEMSVLLRRASPYMEIKYKDKTSPRTRPFDEVLNGVSERCKRIKIRHGLEDKSTPVHLDDREAQCPPALKNVKPLEFKPKRKERWTQAETEALMDGLNTFGVGNWKFILQEYREVLYRRTAVNLKDRYRTLVKGHHIEIVEEASNNRS